MNIYNLNEENVALLEDGLIDINKLCEIDNNQLEDQLIDIAAYIKNLEHEEEGVTKAIKEMQDRKKVLHKKIDVIEDFLKINMMNNDIDKITKSPYFAIKLKKCPHKVYIDSTKEIPGEYLRVKIENVINKEKIADELKNGVILDFAKLVQDVRVEIK